MGQAKHEERRKQAIDVIKVDKARTYFAALVLMATGAVLPPVKPASTSGTDSWEDHQNA